MQLPRKSGTRHFAPFGAPPSDKYHSLPSPVTDCNSNSATWRVSFHDSHTSQPSSQRARSDLHRSTGVPFRVDESSAKVSLGAHTSQRVEGNNSSMWRHCSVTALIFVSLLSLSLALYPFPLLLRFALSLFSPYQISVFLSPFPCPSSLCRHSSSTLFVYIIDDNSAKQEQGTEEKFGSSDHLGIERKKEQGEILRVEMVQSAG